MSDARSRLALAALGRWIRTGKPRQEVCEKLGISASSLSRYLSGERTQLQAETLARFEAEIPRGCWPPEPRDNDRTPRVFVSSTWMDNAERRRLVEDAILSAGCLPVTMEHWTSSELPVLEHCLEKLYEADVLVGIVAWRYGHVPAGQEHSITELEFRHAGERGLDRLMFFFPETPKDIDAAFDPLPQRWTLQQKLEEFRGLIRSSGCTPVPFKETTLGKLVMQALQDWKRRRGLDSIERVSAPTQQDAETSAALAAYYELMLRYLGRLQTGGFKTPFDLRIEFQDLYVPLALEIDREHWAEAKNLAYGLRPAKKGWRGRGLSSAPIGALEELETDSSRTTMRAALEQLYEVGGRQRALVLLGHPGSGKTTLGKGLVVLRAQHGAEKLGLPADVVPVFIELRACGKAIARLAQGPDEPALAGLISERLRSEPYELDPEQIERILGQRLLVILDGLDEVPSQNRNRIRDWVMAFTGSGSDHRVLVTSRFLGYSEGVRLPREQTQVLEILTLDLERRERIVRRWFAAAARAELAHDEADSELGRKALSAAHEQASNLLAALDADLGSNLEALASNPLLLTVLCVVFRKRRGALPASRVELYEEYVDGLLALWRENQAIAMRLSFDLAKARRVLERIARWLHEVEGRTQGSIDDPEFVGLVQEALERAGSAADFDARTFLEAIRDESGLIVGHSSDDYGFLHLRFQEYLAACELRLDLLKTKGADAQFRKSIREMLVDRLDDAWWREVLHGLFGNPHSEPLFAPFVELALAKELTLEQRTHFHELMRIAPYFDPEPFLAFLGGSTAGSSPAHTELAQILLRQRAPNALKKFDVSTPVGLAGTRTRGAEPTFPGDAFNALGLRFARIAAGNFRMGSPRDEAGRFVWEWNLHAVTVPAFSMAITPVTNAQYRLFLSENPWAERPAFRGDERFNQPDQPVVGVSWEEAMAYCRWAEAKLADGSQVRLPSEAEWEYACRAGTTSRFWSGDGDEKLATVGWFDGNSGGTLHAVAEKPANPWGLHDMHGNVWEWCMDWFCNAESKHAKQVAGQHPAACEQQHSSDPLRVLRGGCFVSGARYARSAYPYGRRPGDRGPDLAFRPVRVTP